MLGNGFELLWAEDAEPEWLLGKGFELLLLDEPWLVLQLPTLAGPPWFQFELLVAVYLKGFELMVLVVDPLLPLFQFELLDELVEPWTLKGFETLPNDDCVMELVGEEARLLYEELELGVV